MAPEKISGRIGSRLVGIVELVLTATLLGLAVWYSQEHYLHKLDTCRICVLLAIVFGIYFIVGITMPIVLIISTFPFLSLHVRKWIAVYWCLFNMVSFIGAVIFICVSGLFEDITRFLLMIGFLIKLAVFFCIVCTYVWGLSEKIQDKKMYAMPVSPVQRRKRQNNNNNISLSNKPNTA